MSLPPETHRSLCSLLQRAAMDQLQQATQLLTGSEPIPAEDVHRTRKAIKRVRAILKLIRGDIGANYGTWNHQLQAVNRQLSSTRDLDVCLVLLTELSPHQSPGNLDLINACRTELLQQRESTACQLGAEERMALVKDLRTILQALLTWENQTPESELLRPAIRSMVKQARRKLRDLTEDSHSEEFHALRKIVKLRLYWLEFLQPIWPRGLGQEHKMINSLSDSLGKHHDWDVLQNWLQSSRLGQQPMQQASEISTFCQQIQGIQRNQARQFLVLARLLFAERAKAFSRRWEAVIHVWQTQGRHPNDADTP